MHYISNPNVDELFVHIPDFTDWDLAENWLQTEMHTLAHVLPEQMENIEFTFLDWKCVGTQSEAPFGLYASKYWRKFVLSTFLADLISYEHPADRVDFARLLFVMHAYPEGFRTWWIRISNGPWHPIGYTGWYPMLETAFELFEKKPETLKDRLVAPNTSAKTDSSYLYLFNYSAAVQFKGSDLTRYLMKKFITDIESQHPTGLACITVSEEGMRIAKRFGMKLSGYLSYADSKEGVYTVVYRSTVAYA